jgi:hypothetical protein
MQGERNEQDFFQIEDTGNHPGWLSHHRIGAGAESERQYKCKDVMREPDENRAVAIAFLHGYLLGKSGDSKFNIEALEKQTDAFIEQCLDSPQAKAEDVMLKLKK